MDAFFDIFATLAKNYKAKTVEGAKILDFHIVICIAALVLCEFYRTLLKGSFNESYNIAFLLILGSFSLTCEITRLYASAHV